jgi:hypothetical protein
MIVREEVDIDRVDDLRITRRVLFPIAVSLAIGRTTEIINVRVKTEVYRDVRPA